jgi:hypothetical protein
MIGPSIWSQDVLVKGQPPPPQARCYDCEEQSNIRQHELLPKSFETTI